MRRTISYILKSESSSLLYTATKIHAHTTPLNFQKPFWKTGGKKTKRKKIPCSCDIHKMIEKSDYDENPFKGD